MTCTQPGCTGTIVDGYCDVCGMAAGSNPVPVTVGAAARRGAAPAPTPAPSVGPSIPEGGACQQPGCSGTIEAGYCNVCGTPADQLSVAGYAAPAELPSPDGQGAEAAGPGTGRPARGWGRVAVST